MVSKNQGDPAASPTHRVLVWDLSVRLFHWLLAAGVAAAWFAAEYRKEIGDFTMTIHKSIGLGMMSLILFRVTWGLIGSQTARFSDFVKSPGAALKHARDLRKRSPTNEVGHNALGGYFVVLMIAAVAVQTSLGLFANDEIAASGPLNRFVSRATGKIATELHELNFNIILGLAGIHIAAILFYKVWKRDALTSAMITGRKIVPDRVSGKRMVNPIWGLLILAIIGTLIFVAVDALKPPMSPFDSL